jgi:hypothetical protein
MDGLLIIKFGGWLKGLLKINDAEKYRDLGKYLSYELDS